MKAFLQMFGVSVLLAAFCQCGFLSNPRVSRAYAQEVVSQDAATCLVTWPIHVVGLPVAALVDQTIRTFEILPDAGRDAADFFLLRGDGNNIILERTVAVPKAVVSPLVFVGSYVARWFYPFGEDDRPFYDQRGADYAESPEPAPVPEKESAEPPPAPAR